jgi:hypothetical protein
MPATITVKPWHDPVIDALGHDPRSRYVETFWLPTLGPTAVLLLRHLADRFDRTPEGVVLTVADTSHALGLGQRDGTSSPILRTLRRLTQFDLACEDPLSDLVAVRRLVPPVGARHLRRLPADVQAAHAEWAEPRHGADPLDHARRRARRIAFTLLEQGDDPDHVERVLHATGFHPALCHDAARWAYERHRKALEQAPAYAPAPAAAGG